MDFPCFIFCLCIFLVPWMNTINDKKQFQAKDIKYRSLKVTHDKALLELLYRTDSLYHLNPQNMQQWVVQEVNRQKCLSLLVKRKEKQRI